MSDFQIFILLGVVFCIVLLGIEEQDKKIKHLQDQLDNRNWR